jgi:CxxC motif-containing protein (DUF1111 family)
MKNIFFRHQPDKEAAHWAATLLLSTLILVSLSGCGADGTSADSGTTTEAPVDTTPDPSTDPDTEEPREWQAVGGAATVTFQDDLAFLQFIPGLDLATAPTVSQGRELFVADWTAAPGSRTLLDGLGPLFIASACDDCHLVSGRAASLNDDGTTSHGILFRLGTLDGQPDTYLGGQLQTSATVGAPEGRVTWQDIGLGQPQFQLSEAEHTLDDGVQLGPRLSPQLTGVGLLELVPEAQILQWHDPDDQDQDGISGRAHSLEREGVACLGRFGWKAVQCTLRGQSAGALHQDMGLTTPLNPAEPCTDQQSICSEQPSGGDPEVSLDSLNAINDFLTLLAVYDRRIDDQTQFDRGAGLFEQVGCDDCHRPTLTTGDTSAFEQLNQQTIYAYTDLLLHDMGEALSDGMKEGDAGDREWKTPPLWGLGLIEGNGDSRFLHDGRAETLVEAINWHGGEAEAARQAWEALQETGQQDLLVFLRGI